MVYDLLNFNHSPHILNYHQVCRLLADYINMRQLLASILIRLLPVWLSDTQPELGQPRACLQREVWPHTDYQSPGMTEKELLCLTYCFIPRTWQKIWPIVGTLSMFIEHISMSKMLE